MAAFATSRSGFVRWLPGAAVVQEPVCDAVVDRVEW